MQHFKNSIIPYLLTLLLIAGILPTNQLLAFADTANLITNPSAETAGSDGQPSGWAQGSWGNNTASFTYDTTAHTGSHALTVQMSNYSDGDAKWYFAPVAVTPGTIYNFSDYYKSTVSTTLTAQFTASNGSVSYQDMGNVQAGADWTPSTASFTAPANAQTVSIFHLINCNGTLTTDDASLTVAPPPAPVPAPTPQPVGSNSVPNPSVETISPTNPNNPDGWQTGKWGTNTTQFSYMSSGAESGSRALQVQTTAYTSGDAKWYFTPQPVVGSNQYVFSDYYKSTINSNVVVQFDDGNGNYSYMNLGDATASANWKQYTYVFNVPANAKNATVLHLIAGVGTLQTDNFSLINQGTPIGGAVGNNLIADASFETPNPNNNKLPYHWQTAKWGTNSPTFTYLNNAASAHTGNYAVQIKMSNYTSGDAKWFNDPVPVTSDSQYRYSDWYQGTVQTQVYVAFTMADGSSIYELIGSPDVATSWTQFSTTFTVPKGAVSMTAYHLINRNGSLTLDDASLTPYQPVGFNQAMVSIDFDDGYDTAYNYTLPLLQKYGLKSTQYIVSGFIDTPGYLSLSQLKTLAATQEIGAHSITHPNLTTESQKQFTNELTKSQTQLQQWTDQPVNTFAYPEGAYNNSITSVAKQHYAGARGVEVGLNSKDNLNPYDIKVQNITSNTTAADIADWVAQAQATNTWLVLVYHAVDPDPNNPVDSGPYTITPDQLDSQLSVIKNSGIAVLPMSQALAEAKSQQ